MKESPLQKAIKKVANLSLHGLLATEVVIKILEEMEVEMLNKFNEAINQVFEND